MILAGDIGGTTTRLAVYEQEHQGLKSVVEKDYPSGEYSGLDAVAREFLGAQDYKLERACFGIAGPIRDGHVETPNLPWQIDARELARELHIHSVDLINDLEAHAYGLPLLAVKDFTILHPGAPDAKGNQAIIAAGTGLGEAGLIWDGKAHIPYSTESGHADFAPRNELEIGLLRYLLRESKDHVSYERVISGPGLYNVYRFLRERGEYPEPPWLVEQLKNADPAAAITQAGLAGTCRLCSQALDLFVSCYGAEAGNLALRAMATGGIFIGGGIAPKILTKLKEPPFLEAFFAKGRMRTLVEQIPVRVILNDKAALLGAANYALLHSES
ncbi:MAG: glucokinase [Gammaproteobacteria bacterium]